MSDTQRLMPLASSDLPVRVTLPDGMILVRQEEVDSTTNSIPWKEYGNNAMAFGLAGLGFWSI